MKLINYDALEQYAVEYQEKHRGDELTRGEFKLIDNFMFECPKTDAIPVEWLDDRANDITRAPLFRRYAQQLLDEWQKEQEGQAV